MGNIGGITQRTANVDAAIRAQITTHFPLFSGGILENTSPIGIYDPLPAVFQQERFILTSHLTSFLSALPSQILQWVDSERGLSQMPGFFSTILRAGMRGG